MTTDMVDKVYVRKTEVLNVLDESIKFKNSVQNVFSDRGKICLVLFFIYLKLYAFLKAVLRCNYIQETYPEILMCFLNVYKNHFVYQSLR